MNFKWSLKYAFVLEVKIPSFLPCMYLFLPRLPPPQKKTSMQLLKISSFFKEELKNCGEFHLRARVICLIFSLT